MSSFPDGTAVDGTNDIQKIDKFRVYAGADGDFTLYQDDGETYAYEKGDYKLTRLHWDDAAYRLTHQGTTAWMGPDSYVLEGNGAR